MTLVRSACGIRVQTAMICLRLSICLLVVLMTSSGVAIGGREERQDCSLGEVQKSLEGSEELRDGGVYLMPEAIDCNGELVGIQACAFLNRIMNTNLFRLRVLVFRALGNDTHELHLIYRQTLDIISNASQGCAWSHLRQLSVNKEDRVGVEIGDTCEISANNRVACPAQVNLINSSNASALYHTSRLGRQIWLSDFTAVGVNLNVQVSIVPAILPTTVLELVQSAHGCQHSQVSATSQSLMQSTFTPSSFVILSPSSSPSVTEATGDSHSAQQLLDPGQIVGIIIAAVTFALLFLILFSLIICWLHIQRVHSKKGNTDVQTIAFSNVNVKSAYHLIPQSSAKPAPFDTTHQERASAIPTDTSPVSEQLHLLPQNFVIQGSRIKLLKSIGEGAFGIVYKAHYSRHEGSAVETVAVKSLKAIFTSGDLQNLVREIQLMQFFDHPNVMPLLGVCLDAGCLGAESAPCLVMPYMANGSLLTYLRKAKKALVLPMEATSEKVEQIQRRLFKMCYEIALGMDYLAQNKFVHRDLSARNCMMGSDGTIKVSDFGLSEDIYTKNYFRVDTSAPIAVPFKWMPLESLEEGICNEKTDMWSFGITSWEIFTGGKIPYTAMSVRDVLQLLKSGGRLDKPENAACSEDVYTMMLNCWDDDPGKRPHFFQLVTTLSNMLQTVSGYLNLNQCQVEESLPPLLPATDPTDPPTPMMEAPPSLSSPGEQDSDSKLAS